MIFHLLYGNFREFWVRENLSESHIQQVLLNVCYMWNCFPAWRQTLQTLATLASPPFCKSGKLFSTLNLHTGYEMAVWSRFLSWKFTFLNCFVINRFLFVWLLFNEKSLQFTQLLYNNIFLQQQNITGIYSLEKNSASNFMCYFVNIKYYCVIIKNHVPLP